MPVGLVTQLRFARKSLGRCLVGLSDEDARRRIGPMNCISWMVGHLASTENGSWVLVAQGLKMEPDLYPQVGHGQPASTPPLDEMVAAWQNITRAADRYLDTLTPEMLSSHLVWKGEPRPESIGTALLRTIYHYWFHTGEAYAVRQSLGHTGLPEFVGDMAGAEYEPEHFV
jgi:uncharacterized damage-inducible protein DinB